MTNMNGLIVSGKILSKSHMVQSGGVYMYDYLILVDDGQEYI